MAAALPETVSLIEVGPRDGLQSERIVLGTSEKRNLVEGLISAGFREIQVTAFVHPERVPQMADAEALTAGLRPPEGVLLNALVLNRRGLDRALAAGVTSVEVSVSPSDFQSRRNVNMSSEENLAEGVALVHRAKEDGAEVRAGLQCCFGCAFEGEVPETRILEVVDRFLAAGADRIGIADTTGMGTPPAVRSLLEKLLPRIAPQRLILHLHDTRGMGLVNVVTALEYGVRQFDVALGGLGGCPFLEGASGNIASEDTVHLMDALGISTGIDKSAVARMSSTLEGLLGRTFPSRMLRVYHPVQSIGKTMPPP